MNASAVANSTEISVINPIVKTFLLAVYIPIFTCSSFGLFVLYKYHQKESGPSSPFLKMVVKVTAIGAVLGKEIFTYEIFFFYWILISKGAFSVGQVYFKSNRFYFKLLCRLRFFYNPICLTP